ncbi:MAG: nucleoside-diphosphate-sugar epimerase [Rhodobacteraceae bacterium HLUCCA12]|nr:MAG: nucleoside-diphosphate-sugar epimerase [Rhodobacteraceae bacterium HLUCCA12]
MTPDTSHAPLDLIVTGASGRVGRLLSAVWAASHARVALQSRRKPPLSPVLPQIAWSPLEGTAPFCDWVARHGAPRAMLVLAGATPGTGPDLALNRHLAEACLEAAHRGGVSRVLVASSSAVYGGGRLHPWSEVDRAQTTTPYGRAKLDMEGACAPWRDRGLEVCCLRIGNVAGADALLLNARSDAPLVIDRFADGEGPRRSYIGPASLARVVRALALTPRPLPPVLNVAAPVPVRMSDLAGAAGLAWRWQTAPASAVQTLTLDCSALAGLVAFDDTESTAAGLVAQWNQCRTRP